MPAVRGASWRTAKHRRDACATNFLVLNLFAFPLRQVFLEWFKNKVNEVGGGNYQTLINQALREYLQYRDGLLAETLRRVIQEELAAPRD